MAPRSSMASTSSKTNGRISAWERRVVASPCACADPAPLVSRRRGTRQPGGRKVPFVPVYVAQAPGGDRVAAQNRVAVSARLGTPTRQPLAPLARMQQQRQAGNPRAAGLARGLLQCRHGRADPGNTWVLSSPSQLHRSRSPGDRRFVCVEPVASTQLTFLFRVKTDLFRRNRVTQVKCFED